MAVRALGTIFLLMIGSGCGGAQQAAEESVYRDALWCYGAASAVKVGLGTEIGTTEGENLRIARVGFMGIVQGAGLTMGKAPEEISRDLTAAGVAAAREGIANLSPQRCQRFLLKRQ